MRTTLISLFFLVCSVIAFSQDASKPYNNNADVKADIRKAIQEANIRNKHVLIQWGGNWCPWCIRFHKLAISEHRIDSVLRSDYVYVLANVPKEKNLRDYKLYGEYGYPNRFGFPVFVILDGNGKQLHIQDSGLLEYAKSPGYDTTKVLNFLEMWNVKAVDPATYSGK
jgi:thioredoxin-related protein